MGQRKFPPLTPREIIAILIARGFVLVRTRGDHEYYQREVKGRICLTHVDTGAGMYNDGLIKQVLQQCGMTREQLYCSTKTTAKKINSQCETAEKLKSWATP